MREILLTGEEPNKGPPSPGRRVANRPAQHRIRGFQCIQQTLLGGRSVYVQLDLPPGSRERREMLRQDDTDHGNACTSTDRTLGRSRTIGFHVSPASGEA